uniref:Putative E3 ubiquitin-protein ligase LIN ARM repeats domain-containing protein n=1 Tax=Arundo donax TaxID=35708 RepID=A0A0A9GXB4_ARUDO
MRGIKRKGFHLSNLATALKRDVHEATILVYLLDPTSLEIKNLYLLPSLLHVACNSDTQKWPTLLPLTPTSASIALIEILVTSFNYVTNNVHLSIPKEKICFSQNCNAPKLHDHQIVMSNTRRYTVMNQENNQQRLKGKSIN